MFHKLLRRLVAFFMLALLASSAALAAADPIWWLARGAAARLLRASRRPGGLLAHSRWGRLKPLWVPYFFCLANLAAALAVVSLLAGVRFEIWEPVAVRGVARS